MKVYKKMVIVTNVRVDEIFIKAESENDAEDRYAKSRKNNGKFLRKKGSPIQKEKSFSDDGFKVTSWNGKGYL